MENNVKAVLIYTTNERMRKYYYCKYLYLNIMEDSKGKFLSAKQDELFGFWTSNISDIKEYDDIIEIITKNSNYKFRRI